MADSEKNPPPTLAGAGRPVSRNKLLKFLFAMIGAFRLKFSTFLLQRRFLFRRQNVKHFLTHSELLAHQFRFEAS